MSLGFDDAKCRGLHGDIMFPPAFDEDPQGTDSEYYEVGRLVCSICPHIDECRELGAEEKFGMWGGATPTERRRGLYREPSRIMTEDVLGLIPGPSPHRIDIQQLRKDVRAATKPRSKVNLGS